MSQEIYCVRAQVVLVNRDAEGRITGPQPLPEIREFFYPYTAGLEQYLDEVRREIRGQEQAAAPPEAPP